MVSNNTVVVMALAIVALVLLVLARNVSGTAGSVLHAIAYVVIGVEWVFVIRGMVRRG